MIRSQRWFLMALEGISTARKQQQVSSRGRHELVSGIWQTERFITGWGVERRRGSQVQLLLSAASTENPFLTRAGAGHAVRSSGEQLGGWGGVPRWQLSQGLPSSLSHRRLHRDRKGRWSDSVFLIKLMRWGCWQQIHPFSPSPGTLKRAAAPPVPAELPSEGSKEQALAEPLIAGMGSASLRGTEQAGVGAQPSCSEPGCSRFSLSAVIFVPLLHVNWCFLFPFFWLKHLLLMLTNNKSFFPPARRGCKSIQKRGWGGGKGLHALFPASALQPSLWLSATLGGSTTNPPHQRAFCQERQGLQNVLVGLQGCWKLARPRLSARLTGFLSSSYQERWGGCLTPSLCCRKVK